MSGNSLHLTREVKVYWRLGTTGSKYWEIPVLDGMSFSQGTNITEITVAEMVDSSGATRRGRMGFNDSLNPAEWSFSTYARPFKSADGSGSGHHAVEEVLWASMAGASANNYTANSLSADLAGSWSDVINSDAADMDIDFASSNILEFADAELLIHFPANGDNEGGSDTSRDLWYKIQEAVVNEATIDFDLDGITTINWSGFGTLIEDVSESAAANAVDVQNAVTQGITETGNFIRNRLTQLSLTPDTDINSGSAYNLVLTGGNITISNNIEYITPSSLAVVNRPIGSVNGTRSVTGNFTCYLNNALGTDIDSSGALFKDMVGASTDVKNNFVLNFQVGGTTAVPRVEFNFPQAHLEIPTHAVDDLVSVEVNFHGLPSSISETDEMTIKYVGATI